MEKPKRTRPSKSVTFTLNPKNPNEARLIELLEKRVSVQTSSYKYAVGTELIRELVLLGLASIERTLPIKCETQVDNHKENCLGMAIPGGQLENIQLTPMDLSGTNPV